MTEITEIVRLDADRVDAVFQPANGFPILMMKAVDKKGRIDEAPDIDGAEHVLQLLANLIIAEAQEMAAGHFDEICDVEMLVEAARLIKYFRLKEMMTADEGDPAVKSISVEDIEAAARHLAKGDVTAARELIASRVPNLSKDQMSETETSVPANEDVSKETETSPDIDNLVKSAVAEATGSAEKRIKALEDQLAKVLETPIPGGPVMTAPAHMRSEVQKAEKLAEAARFSRLAEEVSDADLQRYYTERAEAAKAMA